MSTDALAALYRDRYRKNGFVEPEDMNMAADLFEKGAATGFSTSQWQLAKLLMTPGEVPAWGAESDIERAHELLAEAGKGPGCVEASVLLGEHLYTCGDKDEGVKVLERAADSGEWDGTPTMHLPAGLQKRRKERVTRASEDPDLRFGAGSGVVCWVGPAPGAYCLGEGWVCGKVLCLHYTGEPGWPEGKSVPYQVELEDGRRIYANEDTNRCIRGNDGDGSRCLNCSAPATHKCSKCKLVYYCDAECQQIDWEAQHKTVCRALRKLERPGARFPKDRKK